ncbi:hypothetical protein LJC22_03690 [Desulfosarcina sp. OttesenSCG-928-G10]|nr:hypothetical protein [Desulfosarcina sp. OttesenSCG-928-G10]
MFVTCLVSPKTGLWFAIPKKQTRFEGISFWFYMIINCLCLVAIAKFPRHDYGSLGVAVLIVFIPVTVGVFFVLKGRDEVVPGIMKAVFSFAGPPLVGGVIALSEKRSEAARKKQEAENYPIHLPTLSCACPDWQAFHSVIPMTHPARLCRHLTAHFSEHPEGLPSVLTPYAAVVQACGKRGQGLPVEKTDSIVVCNTVRNMPYVLEVSEKSCPVVAVWAAEKQFSYNTKNWRWARNGKPAHADLLERAANRMVIQLQNRRKKQRKP